jgi:hypothetical protein
VSSRKVEESKPPKTVTVSSSQLRVCPQTWSDEHVVHALPPEPHESRRNPDTHCPAEQQPFAHDATSQTHEPAMHSVPAPHVPVAQTPPHPSLAPHALPAQLGTQAQIFPLPHVAGGAHTSPTQHGCPAPPQPTHAPFSQTWAPAAQGVPLCARPMLRHTTTSRSHA